MGAFFLSDLASLFQWAVVDIVQKLLPLGESTYWLTKVELLETFGCLDFTVLSLFDKKAAEVFLQSLVFKLIGDSDYRHVVYTMNSDYVWASKQAIYIKVFS